MKPINIIIAGLVCVLSLSASAKQGDLQQELKIQSDTTNADIKNSQLVYYGSVIVTQGSLIIRADELRAIESKESGEQIIIAKGKPATYNQEMDDGKQAKASANEIRYSYQKGTLTLIGDAKLDQAGSQVSANQMRYNIASQQLIAESEGTDRVTTIIKPENYQGDKKTKQPEPK